MKKFPSIEQFRNVIRTVKTRHDYQGKDESGEPIYNHGTPYPTIKFTGTTKIHGTNSALLRYADGTTKFQSRERELSLEFDNAGFMQYFNEKNLDWIFNQFPCKDYVAIYGEWCGQGIQKGVAVSQLPKRFIIFGIKVDDTWLEYLPTITNDIDIFTVTQFGVWEIDIDFNEPERSQNQLIDWTLEVEKSCPCGKFFDVDGIGEGIVFTGFHNGERLVFKSKGELHKNKRVPNEKSNNTEIENLNTFAKIVTPEWRLEQILWETFDLNNGGVVDIRDTGKYIKNVIADILKEESDTLIDYKISISDISKNISRISKEYMHNHIKW